LRLVVHREEDDKTNEIKEYTDKIFEDIKYIDEFGNEYWKAKELMEVLEYKEWRKFNKVIQKAMEACDGSNYYILDHFVLKDKMVSIGSNTSRKIKDYKLSRYACYLIVQNCNPWIKIIALAQTDAKLKRDNIDNEYAANFVHYEAGKEVRNSIKKLGGTMPENLPLPDKSLKELEKDNKKLGIKNIN